MHNKTVPISILKILAIDSDEMVRRAVAQKRKLTYELFELLVKYPSELVKSTLISNKKLPLDLLRQLANDDIFIRNKAKDKLFDWPYIIDFIESQK